MLPPEHDIYDRLDEYFVDVARELPPGDSLNDSVLVHNLVLCFVGYSTGTQFISRLLN